MTGFRSHDRQHSDRVPIKRSVEEKRRMLIQLKEQQAAMKPWVAEAMKVALSKKIADLEAELRTLSQ